MNRQKLGEFPFTYTPGHYEDTPTGRTWRNDAPKTVKVAVYVDAEKVVREIAGRAVRSKSGTATAQDGGILVHVLQG